MAYTKQTWADLPSKTTPINASRLTHIEDGIYNAADAADDANTAIGNLATVASTGSYNDLSNKPTLGTAAAKNSTNAVDSGSTALVESGAVYNAIETAYENLQDELVAKTDIAPTESTTTASQAYNVGDQLYYNGTLYTVTTAISSGGTIVTSGSGANVTASDSVTGQIKSLDSRLDAMETHKIYGFHIAADESDPDVMVTYLADAVDATPAYMDYTNDVFNYGTWEHAFFMPKPCMLKSDGTVDYYLDPDDLTKKADGTASDIANTSYDGNAMVEWGQNGCKIWLKIVPDEHNLGASVFIANYQADDGFHDWNFHNCDGESADHFYTPIYNGCVISNKMRSLSGQQVSKSLSGTQEMDAAKANNATAKELWNIECYADRLLINCLLILMGKSVDTQTVFGQGLNTSGSEAINDAFRTGVHNDKGMFYGTNSGAANTYTNAVKVFFMENYHGFQWRRTNGLILSDGGTKVKLTYGQEDGSGVTGYNTDGADYIPTGATALSGTSGQYIKTHWFTEDGMFPCGALGDVATQAAYYCDACWYNDSGARFALFGGPSHNGAKVGAFYCALHGAVSIAAWFLGASVSCKPLA